MNTVQSTELFCTCAFPVVVRSSVKPPECRQCGRWWMEGVSQPEGEVPPPPAPTGVIREQHKIKPDVYAPCFCGSGKKLKWCCFNQPRHVVIANMKKHSTITHDKVEV